LRRRRKARDRFVTLALQDASTAIAQKGLIAACKPVRLFPFGGAGSIGSGRSGRRMAEWR